MSKKVEELIIYKQYIELLYYTELITEKFPKSEKLSLVATIKSTSYDGIKKIIEAYKAYTKEEKIAYLSSLDSDLKFLKVLVRISYKRKYITHNNHTAWVKKLTNICNLLGGWIKACQRR